jgi:hypothetical protein
MSKLSLLLLCLFLSSCVSCSNEGRNTKEIKQLLGRHIDFDDDYRVIPDTMLQPVKQMLDKDTIIISYIDELPCTECTVKMLKKWHEFVGMIGKDIQLIVVIKEECPTEIETLILDNHLGPVLIYENDKFEKRNGLGVLAVNKTFLLNSENEIILVGEPYGNRKMIDLYSKIINN